MSSITVLGRGFLPKNDIMVVREQNSNDNIEIHARMCCKKGFHVILENVVDASTITNATTSTLLRIIPHTSKKTKYENLPIGLSVIMFYINKCQSKKIHYRTNL